ncbi:beta-galactosidase/beta-glucuronidase [Actinoplanes tereljensis]|uniref:Beta-galactosidase n=1 Tax=Paractinoplanes tereljensis TaxID=571912 RepID=A0A919NRL5_9ACTN|nr:glycoside hydrolase family 2 TIM barrel-domain containing protein [Actinoplanes tereljensis]GIF22766.1 beta-galactosidase [Actinoplanes tereljensis]
MTAPRPQLVREHWADLSGEWRFDYEPDRWSRTIVVPFPPESAASGIGDTEVHDVLWYERDIPWDTILAAGYHPSLRPRLVVRFGAVDYRCTVWLNGVRLGDHEGGHTPFGFDASSLKPDQDQTLTVRAEDRAADVGQPRGKQDWQRDAHVIWYDRTSGIWQPVWLEATAAVAVESLHWTADLPAATVRAEIGLNRPPEPGTSCEIELRHDDWPIGAIRVPVTGQRTVATITLPGQQNGQAYEDLLWSPERPTLIDATVRVGGDEVTSYLGLRSAAVADGHFLLNDRPYYLRSVLSQGFWPSSHLAAPSAQAIEEEVRLILSLGFNTARVHQKVEDPRFLYWADRLGLLVWGEAPAAYEFSPTAVARTTREWLEVLERDRSHPSIVTWVPHNESWGIQHVAHDPRQAAFVRGLYELTHAIDGTRPVIANDGWEHVGSDILSVHDYDDDPATLRERYGPGARERLSDGIGPAGRRMRVRDPISPSAPLMLTEFGGIKFAPDGAGSWGYSAAGSAEQFAAQLTALYAALRASPELAGTCYTQLTDTMQEANGLVTADRTPKLDVALIRSIVSGTAPA